MTTSNDSTNDRLREAHPTDFLKVSTSGGASSRFNSPSMCEGSSSIPEKLSEQCLSIVPQPTNDLSGGNCFRQAGRLTGPCLHSIYVILLDRGISHGLS